MTRRILCTLAGLGLMALLAGCAKKEPSFRYPDGRLLTGPIETGQKYTIIYNGAAWVIQYETEPEACSDAYEITIPYQAQLEKVALRNKAYLMIFTPPKALAPAGKSYCMVMMETGSEGDTRKISFQAPTCEQAAKLVVERMARP